MINELLKAKEEERLIILPCKLGTKVYGFGEKYGFTCVAPVCLNGMSMCHVMGGCYSRRFIVREQEFNLSMLDDFNKTIFLSGEEAEKELLKQ